MKYLNYIRSVAIPIIVLLAMVMFPLFQYSNGQFYFIKPSEQTTAYIVIQVISVIFSALYALCAFTSFLSKTESTKITTSIVSIVILFFMFPISAYIIFSRISSSLWGTDNLEVILLFLFIILAVFEISMSVANMSGSREFVVPVVEKDRSEHKHQQDDFGDESFSKDGLETEDPKSIKDKVNNLHANLKKSNSEIFKEISKTGEFAGMVISHPDDSNNEQKPPIPQGNEQIQQQQPQNK